LLRDLTDFANFFLFSSPKLATFIGNKAENTKFEINLNENDTLALAIYLFLCYTLKCWSVR
jgi:hypothetical protein